MSSFRPLGLALIASLAVATAVVALRPATKRVASAPEVAAAAPVTSPAASPVAAAPVAGRDAQAAAPAAESQPRVFGERGPVRIDDIPAGSFRRELAALTTDARDRALAQLGARHVPVNNVASLRADRHGHLFYHCPPPAAHQIEAALAETPGDKAEPTTAAAKAPAAASVPISSPPVRHSRPGATKVIYLDFNGDTITGTAWNEAIGAVGEDDYRPPVAVYYARPYDSDGNAATFSDSEQTTIIEIWARIAEDFAPFDVDVTTEAPAVVTTRTGRIVFTPDNDANGKAMPDSATAGGIAYLGDFGADDYAYYSPAFVYYEGFYGDAGNIADAGSHEMGHNLGLSHDGTATDEYYDGHYQYSVPSWGPIMGSPYYRTLTQWSKGEYYNANNTEDDLALIAADLGYRPDDHGDTNGSATAMAGSTSFSASGVIGSATDRDRFSFTCGNGLIQFTAVSQPVPYSVYGMDLDVALELYDAAGNLLVTSDDSGALTQTITYGANAGTYYLRVKGVGAGAPLVYPPSGYTPYGSLGGYTLTGSLTAAVAPQITQNPGATSVLAGQSTGFYAYASGTPSPTYRWQRLPTGSATWGDLVDGAPYSGTATYNLTVSNPTLGMDGDQFRMVATNLAGSATTTPALLTVSPVPPPTVYTYYPYSTSTTVGTQANFNVYVSSSAAVTYNWQRQASGTSTWSDLGTTAGYSGANSSYLTITSPTLEMNGDSFRCAVSNAGGTVTSASATLTVTPVIPPSITGLPATLAVAYGDQISLYASINGTSPMTYQWYFNNEPVVNENWSNYYRSSVTQAQSGTYTLKVTNSAGTATASVQVMVGAVVGLTITQPPVSQEVVKGSSVSFSIAVTGSQPITYQWKRDGVALPNGYSSYYSIYTVTPAQFGAYTVTVTNDAGSITSSAAMLTVLPAVPPKIVGWPTNVVLSPGNSLSVNPSVTGTEPISYQWYKDGVAIPGATGYSYYSYATMSAANAGIYTLQATNEAGTAASPELVVTWVNTTTPPWLGVGRQGDIVYFLFTAPGRIQRYDLAQEAWLPLVYLPETKVPTAFLPTAEGVYIAYNKDVVRRSLDLQTETPVGTGTATINNLFAGGDWVYFRDGDYNLRVINRSTLAVGPAIYMGYGGFNGLSGSSPVTYHSATHQLYVASMYNSLYRYNVGPDGALGYASSSGSYYSDLRYPTGVQMLPDESAILANTGVIYRPSDLAYAGSIGQGYDDATFLTDGSVVALRGRKLMRHAGAGWAEAGRFTLSFDGAALFRRDDKLFAFGAPATNASPPALQKVPTSALTHPAAPVAAIPVSQMISIDGMFLDANRVVHVVSRSLSGVARWSTTTRQFLPTLPLRGRPLLASYAPVFDRLVLAYSDGALADLFPGSAPVEEAFGNFPGGNGISNLVTMDDMVAMTLRQGMTLVMGSSGEPKYFSNSSLGYSLDSWISPSRRLYSWNQNYSSDNAGQMYYWDVPADGALPSNAGGTGNNIAAGLRATPEGTLLMSPNGRIFNVDLQLAGVIGNKVADGAWTSDSLYTIRVRPDGTEVQKWARITYDLAGQMKLPGIPQRIFRLDDTNLLVVTTVDGYLAFHLISSALEKVYSVVNDATFAPGKPAMFDAEAYLANNSDVAAAIGNGSDRAQKAWEHYWKYGLAEGRTDGDFKVRDYLAQYPNLAAQFGGDLKTAALHWYTVGRSQGLRIPTGFDVAGYFARNLDIAALYPNDPYGAWLHYYNYGVFEGRSFDANFIAAEYLELNTDVKAVFGSDLQKAVMHWFQYGHPVEDRMGRVPIGFNVDSYLARYPDLAAAFGSITPNAVRNVTVWTHYVNYGVLEGRSDGDFEAYSYLATNGDLAAIFGTDVRSAAFHWYFYGRREGRRIPGNFNVQNYRTLYPDIVVIFGDDLYGSWLHYRDTGVLEGRVFDNLFRVNEYLALNPDVATAVGGDLKAAMLHWLFFGKAEGRPGRY